LSDVIKEAKEYIMTKKLKNQAVNVKPLGISLRSYQIINTQTGIQELIIDKHLKDQHDIADAFNKYFSSIIDKISK
jgi:hypothetical protein